MASADCEVRPATEEAAKIVRPALESDETDYSHKYDPLHCAIEINVAFMRDKISKVGHLTAIIEAHFPSAVGCTRRTMKY